MSVIEIGRENAEYTFSWSVGPQERRCHPGSSAQSDLVEHNLRFDIHFLHYQSDIRKNSRFNEKVLNCDTIFVMPKIEVKPGV